MAKMEIYLSFKKSEEALYKEIKTHSCYSAWIKEIIKAKIADESTEKKEVNQKSTKNQILQNVPKFLEIDD